MFCALVSRGEVNSSSAYYCVLFFVCIWCVELYHRIRFDFFVLIILGYLVLVCGAFVCRGTHKTIGACVIFSLK